VRDILTFAVKTGNITPRVTKITFGLFKFLFGVIKITSGEFRHIGVITSFALFILFLFAISIIIRTFAPRFLKQ
jgi:hypothetical protein